jgi:hypothetical protein
MDIETVLSRIERYCEATGRAESTVSRMVFKDGKRAARLREVGSCTIGLLKRANERLDELEAELAQSEGESA